MRIIGPRTGLGMEEDRAGFRIGLNSRKRPVGEDKILLARAHIRETVAARNPIAIGHAPFRFQAVGVRRTRMELAGFFSGHCEIFNHAPNMAAL